MAEEESTGGKKVGGSILKTLKVPFVTIFYLFREKRRTSQMI
jgi:hypothetical protein